jgi:hypothetical protein
MRGDISAQGRSPGRPRRIFLFHDEKREQAHEKHSITATRPAKCREKR